jgi:hypothetical protein
MEKFRQMIERIKRLIGTGMLIIAATNAEDVKSVELHVLTDKDIATIWRAQAKIANAQAARTEAKAASDRADSAAIEAREAIELVKHICGEGQMFTEAKKDVFACVASPAASSAPEKK